MSDLETIRYEVVVSGDQWDHESFRETVSEVEGATIEDEQSVSEDE